MNVVAVMTLTSSRRGRAYTLRSRRRPEQAGKPPARIIEQAGVVSEDGGLGRPVDSPGLVTLIR
jgi:hypothetical protein